MKKFLAVITAICVMLTASITAFAQSHPKSKDVQNEIDKIEQMFYNIGKSKDDKIFHKGRNLNGTDAKRLL